ncbi:hypothetical protein CEXT_33071 [Caerostris extrusa]|uniref:Uncharacterized protein n=1 Tax=Caerostris extrusa TaxID=172846 RepID=A0AAV4Q404_CAEEX|nr:hypothetical protein CEXT_33071 [Caerostris extrusa]
MAGLTTSHILTKCHLFDLIWGRGMDFHLRSLKRVMRKKMSLAFHRREWKPQEKRIPSALSDNKGDEWSRFVPLCDVVRAVCLV